MDDALVAIRLALAGVFVLSGVAKLTDRDGTRTAAEALGVPVPVARLAPIALPAAELAVAATLLPVTTAAWSGGALAVLMAVFVALVATNLARGRRPSCRCFGALDHSPISATTLVRNLVLLAAAITVAAGGRREGADVFAAAPWIDVAAFGGLVALAAFATRAADATAPDPGEPVAPAGSLPVGAPAPDFTLPDARGNEVSLSELRANGLPVLLVFGDPGCPSCMALVPEIATWQRDLADTLVVAFVVSLPADEALRVAEATGIDHLLVQQGYEVTNLFGRLFSPSAVVVEADGTIGSEPVVGAPSIYELVDRTAGSPISAYEAGDDAQRLLGGAGLTVGSPAPDFRLPTATGRPTTAAELGTGALAFVFVQHRCVQCTDLLEYLSFQPELARRAVIVWSSQAPGAIPETLGGSVLVDQLGFLAAAYGVTALPSAVVVEGGAVRSPLAEGLTAVLAMIEQTGVRPLIDVEDVTDDFVPRPLAEVVTITVDGVALVGDPSTGRFQALDGPGQLLWSCFDGSESLAGIAAVISAELGVPPETAREDVLAFARRMAAAGALDGVRPAASSDPVT